MDSKDEAKNLLLGKNARILVSDGRVVSGEIVCVDNEKNVILLDATELRGAIHPDSRQSAIDSSTYTQIFQRHL